MRFLFLKAQMRFSMLRGKYPLGSFLPFCKMPTRNVLVLSARSSPNLGLLTEAGQQHIWFPLVIIPHHLPSTSSCLIGDRLLEVS